MLRVGLVTEFHEIAGLGFAFPFSGYLCPKLKYAQPPGAPLKRASSLIEASKPMQRVVADEVDHTISFNA